MFTYRIGDDAELRLLEDRHAEELFSLVDENRIYLRQWMAWVDGSKTADDTRTFLRQSLEKFAARLGMEVGIWCDGKLAGVISYNTLDQLNKKAVIGYWVGERFQGRGLVTRACRAMVDYAFAELRMNRVELECAVENVKSQAIPERLGFTREGRTRQAEWLYDHFVDHFVYGLLASEWKHGTIPANESRSLEPV